MIFGQHLLVDTLVGAVLQVAQLRHQSQAVAGQAFASVALGDAVDLAVEAAAVSVQRQERLFV